MEKSEKSKKKKKLEKARREYIDNIKKELNNALNAAQVKSGLNIPQLAIKLKETYGFNINRQTLYNLFSFESDCMDYACLLVVCRYFGFDFNKFLSPMPIEGKEESYRTCSSSKLRAEDCPDLNGDDNGIFADVPFIHSVENVRDKFLLLNDEGYTGKFYGYTAPDDDQKENPNIFVLDIDPNDLKTTLTIDKLYKDVNVKGTNTYSYHGIPVYVKRWGIVIFFLVNDDKSGDFIQLAFSYQEYTNGLGLIFRHGILLTGENTNSATVKTKSFLLFRKQVFKKNYKYMLGLLRAPNHNFSIPVKDAEELAEEDKIVKEFLSEYKEILDRNKKEVYVINEDNIMSDRASTQNKYDTIRAMLLLKQKSMLAYVHHYRAKYRYTGFSVKELAKAKVEVDEDNEQELMEET